MLPSRFQLDVIDSLKPAPARDEVEPIALALQRARAFPLMTINMTIPDQPNRRVEAVDQNVFVQYISGLVEQFAKGIGVSSAELFKEMHLNKPDLAWIDPRKAESEPADQSTVTQNEAPATQVATEAKKAAAASADLLHEVRQAYNGYADKAGYEVAKDLMRGFIINYTNGYGRKIMDIDDAGKAQLRDALIAATESSNPTSE